MEDTATNSRSYNSHAPFYELLAYVYSAGQIQAAKLSQIDDLLPISKVLYVGVGPGEDAVQAAKKGAEVTCIDLAPDMLECVRRKFATEGLTAEFICGDVMQHSRTGHYDTVIANFFLNIFPEKVMQRVLLQLSLLIKPGGRLFIADFAPPAGDFLPRIFQIVYYRIVNIFYWILRLAPLHPIYNYPKYFPGTDLELKDRKYFKLFNYFTCYESILAVRDFRS